jgi:hypothetical protein
VEKLVEKKVKVTGHFFDRISVRKRNLVKSYRPYHIDEEDFFKVNGHSAFPRLKIS